ncbi:hypothetical protein HD554DRAFT_34341 [Boletus coccyginus]|nr:hypothetical protein HD554DRAFT_34341 [Boletus coccyginus]
MLLFSFLLSYFVAVSGVRGHFTIIPSFHYISSSLRLPRPESPATAPPLLRLSPINHVTHLSCCMRSLGFASRFPPQSSSLRDVRPPIVGSVLCMYLHMMSHSSSFLIFFAMWLK